MASSDRNPKGRPEPTSAESRAASGQAHGAVEPRNPRQPSGDDGAGQGGRQAGATYNGERERIEGGGRGGSGGRQGQWMQPAHQGEWRPASAGERLGWPTMWADSPFSLMRAISRDVDRMFEQFWESGFGLARAANPTTAAWIPRVDVCERNDELLVRADLPGIDRNDVRVEVEDDAITIRGERREEREEGEGGFQRSERFYGSFFRRIALPEGLDVDHARARMHDGVLEVSLPAPSRHRGRRLQIEGSGAGDELTRAAEPGAAGSADEGSQVGGENYQQGESPRRERSSGPAGHRM